MRTVVGVPRRERERRGGRQGGREREREGERREGREAERKRVREGERRGGRERGRTLIEEPANRVVSHYAVLQRSGLLREVKLEV